MSAIDVGALKHRMTSSSRPACGATQGDLEIVQAVASRDSKIPWAALRSTEIILRRAVSPSIY
jgi:hypothetical protein